MREEFTENDKKYFKGLIDILITQVPADELQAVIEDNRLTREALNTDTKKEAMGFTDGGDLKLGLGLPETLVAYMEQVPELANFFNACHTAPKGARKTAGDHEKAKVRFYWFMKEYPQFKKTM